MSSAMLMMLMTPLTVADNGLSMEQMSRLVAQPNTRLSIEHKRPMTPAEEKRFKSLVGKSPAEVLRLVGHPGQIRKYGKCEVWVYLYEDPIGLVFGAGGVRVVSDSFRQTGVYSIPELVP